MVLTLTFYALIVVATLAGVALNLLRIHVLSATFYTAVINGVVAPPLMVLIQLLGSDEKVMQKRAGGRMAMKARATPSRARGSQPRKLALELVVLAETRLSAPSGFARDQTTRARPAR